MKKVNFWRLSLQVVLLVLIYLLAVAALIRKYLRISERREDSIRLTSGSGSNRQRGRKIIFLILDVLRFLRDNRQKFRRNK